MASKFALVAFTGKIASDYGLTGWKSEDSVEAAKIVFKIWLDSRGSTGAKDDETIIGQIRLFIEQYGDSRFRRIEQSAPDVRTINNSAGYYDGDNYFFSREVFKEEVCKGYDPTNAAKALKDRGLLSYNHGNQWTLRDPDNSKKIIRVYAVKDASGDRHHVIFQMVTVVTGFPKKLSQYP